MLPIEELRSRVQKKVTTGHDLVPLLEVVHKVREVTANANASVKELVRVIGADSVLTSKVLRLVNSAAFGFPGRISNIDQAVVILGFRQLRDLCIGLSMMTAMGGLGTNRPAFDRRALWRHSLATAVGAKLIQERVRGAQSANLFVAGLICNIGRLVMDQFFPEDFDKTISLVLNKGLRVTEAERQVWNVTHADVGYWATNAWGLEESLCLAIRDHHGPPGNQHAAIVNIAYVLAQAFNIGNPGDEQLTPLIPRAFESLGIDEFELNLIIREFRRELDSAEPMFHILLEK